MKLNAAPPKIEDASAAKWGALLGWQLLCVGGGATVGWLTNGGDSAWYRALEKPWWNPPNGVFAPVWTTLYAAMGLAAWLVWRRRSARASPRALLLFAVQLGFNFAWSFAFFSLRSVALAAADIAVLWLLIALTIRTFAQVDRRAAWLLVPYWGWVTFAALLNAAIWWMNRLPEA